MSCEASESPVFRELFKQIQDRLSIKPDIRRSADGCRFLPQTFGFLVKE